MMNKPSRVNLLLRMARIHALRIMIDASHTEWEEIVDEYKEVGPGDLRSEEWIAKSDSVVRRTAAFEKRLEELEREPLDT